jgi:leader peptidase (prepilin peptidase)/N-methyltransferase
MFILFFLFILGLIIGSFINLVIDRTPREESLLSPRSYCDFCRQPLGIGDLVPIMSFLFLKGKCRYCGAALSWRMPLLELALGFLFVLTGLLKPPGFPLPLFLFFNSLLVGIGISDLHSRLIPDVLVYPGILVAGLWSLIFGLWSRLFLSLALVVFFGFVYLFSKRKALGLGDVKLVGLLGLLLDPLPAFLALDFSIILGAGVALVLLITKKKKFGEAIPLAPFLVMGTLVFIFVGHRVIQITGL